MFKSELIVLTGAGASIPVGIPGMVGLAREFETTLPADSPEAKAMRLLRDLGVPEDVEDLLQLANAITALPAGRLQRFLESCVAPRGGERNLKTFRARLKSEVRVVEAFRRQLLRYIVDSCLSFDRVQAVDLYGGLLSQIVRKEIPVFTTNYDTVLDHVAEVSGFAVQDNFVCESGRRYFWDPSLQSFHGKGLRLLKIHGCIQWHATQVGRIERIPVPTERNEEGELVERLMIFPTRFKDIYQQNYFPLYAAFTRSLVSARVLLVVGHSLRDDYLLAAIRERLREPDFHVIVIAPGFPMKQQVSIGIRKGNTVLHIRRELQTVLPLLLQALGETSTNDLPGLLREASSRLRQGEKDKIRLTSFPRWVNAGDQVSGIVELDTINVNGRVRIWIDRNKNREARVEVSALRDGKNPADWGVVGTISEHSEVSFKMPNDLEPARHRLVAALESDEGEVARSEVTVGVRKG